MGLRQRKPGEVSLRLGYPTNNTREGRYASLEVTDEASGMVILEVDLEPDQLLALMSGSTAYSVASILVPKPERVGKVLEVASAMVRNGDYYGQEQEVAAQDLVKTYQDQGWEDVTSRRVRDGISITARRWHAQPPAE